MLDFISVVVVALVVCLGVLRLTERIPKTGRFGDADGEVIKATITNENRTADKNSTMKLVDANGTRYRVKMKAAEAKKWIKGDEVNIILSKKNGKEYRVCFNDYFRQNEERMREDLTRRIEKSMKRNIVARKLVGYKETSSEALFKNGADSIALFVFLTYTRRITAYAIVSFVATVLFLGWITALLPPLTQFAIPLLMLVLTYFIIYNSTMGCKKILAKYEK